MGCPNCKKCETTDDTDNLKNSMIEPNFDKAEQQNFETQNLKIRNWNSLKVDNEDKKNCETQNLKHLIWIAPNYDNEENQSYVQNMKELGFSNIQCFKITDDGINYIKSYKFESTKIILSGQLFIEFIRKFKVNLKDLYIIPKIAIFTEDKKKFLEYNKDDKENLDIINDSFYNYGKINDIYDDIKNFLIPKKMTYEIKSIDLNENNGIKNTIKYINNKERLRDNNIQLTFEYIDCIEKLELPLLYQSIINLTKIDNIENYNKYLYSIIDSKDEKLIELLDDLKDVPNIPIELLCKYYLRLYTMETNFYKELNIKLRNREKDNYLPFIKIIYEGLKLKVLKIASNKELYRGSKISIEEINKIKSYLNNKKPNLPGSIIYSKSYLSFTKNRKMAKFYTTNVLYILEKYDKMDYNISTHSDIEDISFYKEEEEVLFFPFSSFEIKEVNEITEDNNKIFEIKLLYLGKYLKEIRNNKNLVEMAKEIPESQFKNQILDLGLIKRENIQNTKQLFEQFKIYESILKINNENDIELTKIERKLIIIKTELDKNKEYYLKVKI